MHRYTLDIGPPCTIRMDSGHGQTNFVIDLSQYRSCDLSLYKLSFSGRINDIARWLSMIPIDHAVWTSGVQEDDGIPYLALLLISNEDSLAINNILAEQWSIEA